MKLRSCTNCVKALKMLSNDVHVHSVKTGQCQDQELSRWRQVVEMYFLATYTSTSQKRMTFSYRYANRNVHKIHSLKSFLIVLKTEYGMSHDFQTGPASSHSDQPKGAFQSSPSNKAVLLTPQGAWFSCCVISGMTHT